MATYHAQATSLYDKNPLECTDVCESCIGMESGSNARHGNMFQLSWEQVTANVQRRHPNASALAVGDFIELFEVPTYAAVEHLSVFHDCDLKGFRFRVGYASVLDCPVPRTVVDVSVEARIDTERGTTVSNDATPGAIPVMGAQQGRDLLHFAPAPRNNHRAVLRMEVTALPTSGSVWDLPELQFFATFDRYAVCYCAKCAGAYDKSLVTTVTQ